MREVDRIRGEATTLQFQSMLDRRVPAFHDTDGSSYVAQDRQLRLDITTDVSSPLAD